MVITSWNCKKKKNRQQKNRSFQINVSLRSLLSSLHLRDTGRNSFSRVTKFSSVTFKIFRYSIHFHPYFITRSSHYCKTINKLKISASAHQTSSYCLCNCRKNGVSCTLLYRYWYNEKCRAKNRKMMLTTSSSASTVISRPDFPFNLHSFTNTYRCYLSTTKKTATKTEYIW